MEIQKKCYCCGTNNNKTGDCTDKDCETPALEQFVLKEHDKELKRKKATAYNYGWGQTEDGIASKTDRGILSTDYHNGRIEHSWS